jgi:multidrug resistance efflux pump
VNPRYRILGLLGVLLVGSLTYYYVSTDHEPYLVLQGTVDANQVIVSAQVLGQIEQLAVTEGQDVKAGQLIALLDPGELAAAKTAADAQTLSYQSQVDALRATASSTQGDTAQTLASAQASARAAADSLQEATANRLNQELLTRRTVALADSGILSGSDRDTAVQALKAALAHERGADDQMAAADAAMKAAQARIFQAKAAQGNVAATAGQLASARAQALEAGARLGYTRINAPITGKIGLWAARQGEVVNPGAAIVTIVDLQQTWVYAAIQETQADAIQIGDHLPVRMPSGARVDGQVLVKSAEGDFATQRDVSGLKRDIKTVKIKLWIPNPGERYVPGMTAEVLVPRSRLVRS